MHCELPSPMRHITRRGAELAIISATLTFIVTLVTACGSSSSPTAPDTAAPLQDPATATLLTFTQDVQPIINSDCVSCHGNGRQEAGLDFRTYAGVMRVVTPGNANSVLVRATQSGGIMFQQFRGSAAAKSATIRRWVVDFQAVQ
jgi:mono/diheme cytochrome c family protein